MVQEEKSGVGGWQPMETAPRDGTAILLTDGRSSVHLAWYRSDAEPYPWFLVDDLTEHTRDDGADCLELNSAMEVWASHWMPLPGAPVSPTSPTVSES